MIRVLLDRSRLKCSNLRMLLCLAFSIWAFVSCSKFEEKKIGDKLSAPFDIVRVEKWNEFIVVSSAFDGTYGSGNLIRLAFAADGSYEKKQVVEVPRLGTRLSVNREESLLALALSEMGAEVKVFQLDQTQLGQELTEYRLDPERVVTDLMWFSALDGAATRQFLAVELNGNSKASRVQVFEFAEDALKPLFLFPDDLPGARNSVFELGHSSPVFLPEQNLLVFFPNGGVGISGDQPSPYEVLKTGKWNVPGAAEAPAKKAPADLRSVSLVAVDFDLFLKNSSLQKSSFYYPMIASDSFDLGNLELPADDAANSTLKYRTFFVESARAKLDTCSKVAGDKPDDLVLAAQFDAGYVLGLSGWNNLKTKIVALGDSSELDSDRLIVNGLSVSLYSQGQGAPGLSESRLRVTALQSQNIDGLCYPVAVRADVKSLDGIQSNAGRENVWVSHVVGRDPKAPVAASLPNRSSIRFAGNAKDLFFISFSKNSITQVQLQENEFTIGQTRSE